MLLVTQFFCGDSKRVARKRGKKAQRSFFSVVEKKKSSLSFSRFLLLQQPLSFSDGHFPSRKVEQIAVENDLNGPSCRVIEVCRQ